jgi:hypothetical protein
VNLQPRGFEGDVSPSWGACEGAGPLCRSRRGKLLGRPGDGWMVQFLSPAPAFQRFVYTEKLKGNGRASGSEREARMEGY